MKLRLENSAIWTQNQLPLVFLYGWEANLMPSDLCEWSSCHGDGQLHATTEAAVSSPHLQCLTFKVHNLI